MLNDVGGRLIYVHAQFFQSSDNWLFLILIINGNRSHFSQAMRLYMFSQELNFFSKRGLIKMSSFFCIAFVGRADVVLYE